MSDLSMYEFGDIAWDEFCMSDDHMVPHPGVGLANEHSLWNDNYKKPCLGVVGIQDSAGGISSCKNAGQENEREKLAFVHNRRKRMLEKDPEPQTPEFGFNSCNRDSGKEDASLEHNATGTFRDSHGNELRVADAISTDKTAAVDSNSYSYPLSQTEDDISFFDETHDIKDSGDFLYYGLPDIDNLEEVDRIFSNEDEFGWFASSEAVEASTDGSKPEFKFSLSDSSPVESHSNNCEHLRNETHSTGEKFFHEIQGKIPDADHSTNGNSAMMDMRKSQQKHGAQSQGQRKDQYIVNGGYSKSLHDEVSEKASKGASSEVLSCKGIKQEKQPIVHESSSYLPCNIHICPSDILSAIKSDCNGVRLVSPKESYSSNLVLSTENSHSISYQTTPIVPDEKVEKLNHNEVLQSSFSSKLENLDMLMQVPLYNLVSIQKKVQHPADRFGILGDAEEVLTELGLSTLQESSSISSTVDEISLEAASLRQLQLVMEQLDLRTKICIRDSLYRLARSSAQRHNNAYLDADCSQNDQDNSKVMMAEGANEYTGFMDMETDTNPIDRSIAHLLFHRPSAPTAIPAQESSFHNAATAIHGCILKPHMVSGKMVNNESSTVETEGEVADP